ncbi:MAG: hypothetical protein WBF79_08695, partial [Rhodococcus sp. (in: high G+C Gram-positive bacteria)]
MSSLRPLFCWVSDDSLVDATVVRSTDDRVASGSDVTDVDSVTGAAVDGVAPSSTTRRRSVRAASCSGAVEATGRIATPALDPAVGSTDAVTTARSLPRTSSASVLP